MALIIPHLFHIACAADGVDQLGFEPVVYLFPQIADIDVNDVGSSSEVIIPDMLLQLIAGQDDPSVLYHVAQKSVFFPRQSNFPAGAQDAPCELQCSIPRL